MKGEASGRSSDRKLALVDQGGGIGDSGEDVLELEVGIVREYLVRCLPSSQSSENRADGDAHSADARSSAHLGQVDGDPLGGHDPTLRLRLTKRLPHTRSVSGP